MQCLFVFIQLENCLDIITWKDGDDVDEREKLDSKNNVNPFQLKSNYQQQVREGNDTACHAKVGITVAE